MSEYKFDRLRVLVVDDNVHMRKLVTTILQAFGVSQIAEAESADRAWQSLRDINPDVIVLDWVMEGMSGVELIQKIRTNPQAPNPFVPVIMLSGHTSLDHVRQARDAGANEFIAKPVSVRTMMSRLVAVIEHPRPYVRTNGFFGPCRRRRNIADYQGSERRSEQPKQAAG
jgi:CheY-like chemotaxis protein